MKFDFKGKNAIVTGAGSGLGRCIAEELAKNGANVIIVDINRDNAKQVATDIAKYGTRVVAATTDVSKYSEVESLMAKTKTALGSIDILINSAGIGILEPILNMSLEKLDAVVDIDLKGTMYCCRSALKYMKEQHYGKIVNMSSIAGKLSQANTSIYASVKYGIIALTASLGREFAKDGININAILPGIIRTNMWETALSSMAGDDLDKKNLVFSKYTEAIPQGHAQDPIDIANMALFLCSEEAKSITSQNIGVDGGHTF